MFDLPFMAISLCQKDIGVGSSVFHFGGFFKKHRNTVQQKTFMINKKGE